MKPYREAELPLRRSLRQRFGELVEAASTPRAAPGVNCGYRRLTQRGFVATKSFFGHIACTPTLPSTNCVMFRSTATLDSM